VHPRAGDLAMGERGKMWGGRAGHSSKAAGISLTISDLKEVQQSPSLPTTD